jgi:hypothetical protein
MRVKWLLAVLILVVFISGCVDQGDNGIKPEFNDNALSMDIKIQEKIEQRRILPGSTIRMVITLTNQVENATDGVDLKITNPYGIQISKVDCGSGCVCVWPTESSDCPSVPGVSCFYNGCHYDSIQSSDKEEITFGLKIPTEEQISEMGRDLQPKIVLNYNYRGVSSIYIPIYKYGEQPTEPKKETPPPTFGPIKVDIDSDNWVRAGDLFPIYLTVKDVVNPSKKLTINKDDFTMTVGHASISKSTIGRCDFDENTGYTHPVENITLPLKNPIVCTLRAEEPSAPMVKAPIIIDYSYTYEVERTETIRVEKAFLGIF